MLSKDILIQDIDEVGWANLVSLGDRATLYKILGETREIKPPKKRLFVIYQGSNVLKAWHSEKGSILKNFEWSGPENLEEIARREGVDRVTALARGAPGRIYLNFQQKVDLQDDYVKQLFAIFDAVRAELGSGIKIHPEQNVPNIGFEAAKQIFKMFVPHNGAIVFYLFDANTVWASLIVGIKNSDIDLMTSHDALVADGFGFFDWRQDYEKILDAVGRLFREPVIGFFADLKSYARILRSKKPVHALNAARKSGDVIIDPLPMRIKTILSAGSLLGR